MLNEALPDADSRVLRPGGALGLVWTIRDESVPRVAAFTHAMHSFAAENFINARGLRVGAPCAGLDKREFAWESRSSREDLVAMVKSRNYYIAADAHPRATVDARVDEVLATLPALSKTGVVALPYITHAHRTVAP